MAVNTTRFPLRGAHPRTATVRRSAQPVRPSDDEILGLNTTVVRSAPAHAPASRAQSPAAPGYSTGVRGANLHQDAATGDEARPALSGDAQNIDQQNSSAANADASASASGLTPELEQILNAHPQLRAAWDAAQQFQSVFTTPAAAQDAKSQLDELDEMFFSGDPSAQAALAARIHELSPAAFHSLTNAMQEHSAQLASQGAAHNSAGEPSRSEDGSAATQNSPSGQPTAATNDPSNPAFNSAQGSGAQNTLTASAARNAAAARPRDAGVGAVQNSAELQKAAARTSQLAFFHSTNNAAVHQVLAAIESQVAHLLPASVSAPTKTRLVGEIYRDLSSALGANPQLGHQLRQAFRFGAGDAAHQRAIVSLVAGRARQALPSIARRVINEWTHGVVSANQEKISRQSASAKRVDISGAASSDGVNRRPVSPRDVNYKRLSDADILNL